MKSLLWTIPKTIFRCPYPLELFVLSIFIKSLVPNVHLCHCPSIDLFALGSLPIILRTVHFGKGVGRVCWVEQNQWSSIQTVRKSNDYCRLIRAYYIFISFPQLFQLLTVSVIATHYLNWPKAMFCCLKSFISSTKLCKEIFCCGKSTQQGIGLHCLQAPLCLPREQQLSLEKREDRLPRYHINVTRRHWCDFSILWAHISYETSGLKDKMSIRENSMNLK